MMTGDLTASNVPGVQAALKAELDRGVDELAFDLEQTKMVDSSGIGLLVAAHNSLARTQGKLRVRNVSPELLRLLQSMRLADRLNVTGKANSEATHG